jgi:hypothetical protein
MEPTFVFDDSGKAYAMVDGKVVASANTVDELETKLAWGNPGDGYNEMVDELGTGPDHADSANCPQCGGHLSTSCEQCGFQDEGVETPDDYSGEGVDLPAASPDTLPGDTLPDRETHTHIITPNGLKGQILGKHKDLWGEAVTVRFENGRIASYHVADEEKDRDFEFVNEEDEKKKNPIEELKEKVEKETSHTSSEIKSRLTELDEIKKQAYHIIAQGVSYEDEVALDELRTQADHEQGELTAELEYLDSEEAEAFAPPAPFRTEVFEQESLGGGDSTWLDSTLGDMIQEAESTDFDTLMEEGPETFVAELEDAPLADAGVVRQMASNLIRSKTAGIDPEAVNQYEKAFIARVEDCRRARLATRKDEMKKSASAEEDFDGPAEGLFL